ncbi:MAG: hypothetical protein RSE41_09035 [Clostridia bacterium]
MKNCDSITVSRGCFGLLLIDLIATIVLGLFGMYVYYPEICLFQIITLVMVTLFYIKHFLV